MGILMKLNTFPPIVAAIMTVKTNDVVKSVVAMTREVDSRYLR